MKGPVQELERMLAALRHGADGVEREHRAMVDAFARERDARASLFARICAAVDPAFELLAERRGSVRRGESMLPEIPLLHVASSKGSSWWLYRAGPGNFGLAQASQGSGSPRADASGCAYMHVATNDALRRVELRDVALRLGVRLREALAGRKAERTAEALALADRMVAISVLLG